MRIGSLSFDLDRYEHVYIIGAGKATAPMAAALESLLEGHLTAGAITVKYGHTSRLKQIEATEAGHPVPDNNGERGSARIMSLAEKAGENDLVFCLISGGGSALMPMPAPEISLADKQEMTRILLSCGATIHEMNALRKHLSAIKGGQLAAAIHPAESVTLLLSDVVGDDLDVIASGPTVPDNSTFADCMHIVERYGILQQIPQTIRHRLDLGVQGKLPDTPKTGDEAFSRSSHFILGNNLSALKASEKEARQRGYTTLILSSLIEGETEIVSHVHTAIARQIAQTGHPIQPPACILSGGETIVTLKGDGKGGRNQEFVLCGVKDIAGSAPMIILSGGTDGNDGPTDAAGAIADHTTLKRSRAQNLDIDRYLSTNDAYHFFQQLDDLLITGPTNTNVMDIRLLIIPGSDTGSEP